MLPWLILVWASGSLGGVVAEEPKWSFRVRRVLLWGTAATHWGVLCSCGDSESSFRQKGAARRMLLSMGGWELFAEITVMNGGRGMYEMGTLSAGMIYLHYGGVREICE